MSSDLVPAQRISIRILSPIVHPDCCNSLWNAALWSDPTGSFSGRFWRIPTRRIRPVACCALAVTGDAAAAPPSRVMNSRRLMHALGVRGSIVTAHTNDLPPASDIGRRRRHGSFVPRTDSCTATIEVLFDHLVG